MDRTLICHTPSLTPGPHAGALLATLDDPPSYDCDAASQTRAGVAVDSKKPLFDSAEMLVAPSHAKALFADNLERLHALLYRDLTAEEVRQARIKPFGRRAKLVSDGFLVGITRYTRHRAVRTGKFAPNAGNGIALIDGFTAAVPSFIGAAIGFAASLHKGPRTPDGVRVNTICRELLAMDAAIKSLPTQEEKAPLEQLRADVDAFVKQCSTHPSARLRVATNSHDEMSMGEIQSCVDSVQRRIDKRIRLVQRAEDARWRAAN